MQCVILLRPGGLLRGSTVMVAEELVYPEPLRPSDAVGCDIVELAGGRSPGRRFPVLNVGGPRPAA